MQGTSDGSDTKRIGLSSGGAIAVNRGANMLLVGNEFAGADSGYLYLYAGATNTSEVRFRTGPITADAMRLSAVNGRPTLTIGTTTLNGAGRLYIDSLYFGTTLRFNANGDATLGTVNSTGMSVLDTTTTSHLKGKSSAPTIAEGTGAGTSPSVSIVTNSTDLAGEILVRTGTTPTANGDIVTVTFNKNYTRPPQVVLTPSTGLAAAHAALVYIKSTSGSTFVVTDTVTALTASQVYRWKYHVIE